MVATRQSHTGSSDQSEILSQCLQAIERGQATVEGCVARYPEFAELADLLRAAIIVQELPRPLLPAIDRAEISRQVMSQYRGKHAVPQRHWQPQLSMRTRFALLASVCLLFLFLSSTALVKASDSVLPGDGLYGLKRAVEQIPLAFSDPAARQHIFLRMAYRRLAEVNDLSLHGTAINESVLNDTLQDVRMALAAQSNAAERVQLIAQTTKVFEDAQSRGTISAAAKDKILVALQTVPSLDNNGCNAAIPSIVATGTLQSTPPAASTNSPVRTEAAIAANTIQANSEKKEPSPTATLVATNTKAPTATSTLQPTVAPTATATLPFQDVIKNWPTPGATKDFGQAAPQGALGNSTNNAGGNSGGKASSGNSGDGLGNGGGDGSNAGGNSGGDGSNAGGNSGGKASSGNSGNGLGNGGGDGSNAGGNSGGGNSGNGQGNGGGDGSNAGGNSDSKSK